MKHWVFLRGLVRSQHHWSSFPEKFSQAFPDDHVHLIDLPGNGYLCHQRSPLSIDKMVDSVREQLDGMGVTYPVYLFAISMGGMVAIDWMSRFGHQVAGAVIINTSLRGCSTFAQRLKPRNYPKILYNLLVNHSAIARERLILSVSTNLYSDKETLAANWADFAHRYPTSESNAVRQLIAASRFSMPKNKPHDNVLLLSSTRDRLVDAQCSACLASAWQWPIQCHAKAGHDLTLDDSDWVIYQVQQWLNNSL